MAQTAELLGDYWKSCEEIETRDNLKWVINGVSQALKDKTAIVKTVNTALEPVQGVLDEARASVKAERKADAQVRARTQADYVSMGQLSSTNNTSPGFRE